MAIPIIHDWEGYFTNPHEGLGSSYERIILNDLLDKVVREFEVKNALEAPSFGFTGLSGINLAGLARQGIRVSIEDHQPERLSRIREMWEEKLRLPLDTTLNNTGYRSLNYPDDNFDLGFNFSALWFTTDLGKFIDELTRVCSKAILICVPNTRGIGYRMQIRDYSPEQYPELHVGHIDPHSIVFLMRKAGWQLKSRGYIDCPPWPDIGMSKEQFLGRHLKLSAAPTSPVEKPVSIIPFYQGADAGFAERMRKYSFVERLAPNWFKSHWAHHYHLLFTPAHEA